MRRTALSSNLLGVLYDLVRKESLTERQGSRARAGHRFEDVTAQRIYTFAKSAAYKAHPPRSTLQYPTFSGQMHQFDASYSEDSLIHVFECKRRRIPVKEHIYYFNSKIVDYLLEAHKRGGDLRMNGTFLSTVEVGDSLMQYALAYGLTIIDPASPPPQYMAGTAKDLKLKRATQALSELIPEPSHILGRPYVQRRSPSELCSEYRFLVRRWLVEQDR